MRNFYFNYSIYKKTAKRRCNADEYIKFSGAQKKYRHSNGETVCVLE